MTIEEIQTRKECQTFDSKSIQIDRFCSDVGKKDCAIPSFHIDAFILKAMLMAEWTAEEEFDRPSTAQASPKYCPSRTVDSCYG